MRRFWSGAASTITDPAQAVYTLVTQPAARDTVGEALQQHAQDVTTNPVETLGQDAGALLRGLIVDPLQDLYAGIVCDDTYRLGRGTANLALLFTPGSLGKLGSAADAARATSLTDEIGEIIILTSSRSITLGRGGLREWHAGEYRYFEQARNAVLKYLGKIDPATREPHIGSLPASAGSGKIVGFTTTVDGTWKRFRLDYDPDPRKGAHINVEIGKKGVGRGCILNGREQKKISYGRYDNLIGEWG